MSEMGARAADRAHALEIELLRAATQVVTAGPLRDSPVFQSAQLFLRRALGEPEAEGEAERRKLGESLAKCYYCVPNNWSFSKGFDAARAMGAGGMIFEGVPLGFQGNDNCDDLFRRYSAIRG